MGNFFTSSQIYNDKGLNKQQFIDKFCKAMSDSGYTVCDSDESEMSYILRFAEKSKWVAIASELYGEGGQIAQADAGRIAKMLGTYCMNTEVIDSDCAAMSLYGKDGKSADMLLMGRYDDYFGDDTPELNKKIWTQFLSDGSTWEQFTKTLSGEYVFVEDGLAQLAPVIGMDSGNLLFSAEDDVDDESAVFLDFKKAGTKKEKKLTLNAAFKQVFGEALEPLGFKKVKSKYPYYVRVINNEIVQVISFYNEKGGDYQTYTVVGGIATPYRKKIDFSVRPSCHMEWLGSNSKYYFFSDPSDYSYEYDGYLHEVYLSQTADSNKLLTAMKQSFEDVKKWMLPVFNDITTIDDTIIFYLNYHSDCFGLRKEIFDQGLYTQDNEILLLSQIQNEDLVIEKYIQKLKQHNEFEAKIGRAACQVNIEKAKEKLIDSIQYLKYNKKYLALANEYKIRNTEILKSLNLIN